MSIAVGVVAVFFVLMGLMGLATPERIQAPFGTAVQTVDGRNEVRAVYGGFGIAIGALLFAVSGMPALRAGALDSELVVAKRVRKGSVDAYTATTPPHVQAARKAGAAPGSVVRYVVTASGPEPVHPGVPLPGPIDHAYYLERVLRPIAESILEPLGKSFDEALGAPRQLALL